MFFQSASDGNLSFLHLNNFIKFPFSSLNLDLAKNSTCWSDNWFHRLSTQPSEYIAWYLILSWFLFVCASMLSAIISLVGLLVHIDCIDIVQAISSNTSLCVVLKYKLPFSTTILEAAHHLG